MAGKPTYEELEQRVRGFELEAVNLRRVDGNLRASEERLKLALDETDDGIWDWNTITGEIYLDPNWMRILGYEPGEESLTSIGGKVVSHQKALKCLKRQ